MNDITNTFNTKEAMDGIAKVIKPTSQQKAYVNRESFLYGGKQNEKFSQDITIGGRDVQKSKHRLRNKRSRLDMLDNSHLTSFPLAPPVKITENLKSIEANSQDSLSAEVDSDPIILVEDYMNRKTLARKKLSVSDLKHSINRFDLGYPISNDSSGPSYLMRAKSILSEALQDDKMEKNSLLLTNFNIDEEDEIYQEEQDTYNIEEYYSAKTSLTPPQTASSTCSIKSLFSSAAPTIKLTDTTPVGEFSFTSSAYTFKTSLKHCVICDAALYELSGYVKEGESFSEFVCSNCTGKYELLSKLLEEFEQNLSDVMLEDEDDYGGPLTKRLKYDGQKFSDRLIHRLQNQLHNSEKSTNEAVDKSSVLWFVEAKRKLRFRWRVSGLVPKFMT